MSFMLAVRMRLEADETLVDVRGRCLPFEPSCNPSGCGNGTGVDIAPGDVDAEFGLAITGMWTQQQDRRAFCNFGRSRSRPACALGRQPSYPAAGGVTGEALGGACLLGITKV